MPTISAHLPAEHEERFNAAVKASGDKIPGRYVLGAVIERMDREGFSKENPLTELMAMVQEIGPERAKQALLKAQRVGRKEVAA